MYARGSVATQDHRGAERRQWSLAMLDGREAEDVELDAELQVEMSTRRHGQKGRRSFLPTTIEGGIGVSFIQ
jgi:hypothetical protein